MSSHELGVELAALACLAGCGGPAAKEIGASMSAGSHLVAVLDNTNIDKTSPFTSTLSLYQYDYSATSYLPGATLGHLYIDEVVGGTHRLAVTTDGTRIAVVEDLANLVSVFDDDLTPVIPAIKLKPSAFPGSPTDPVALAVAITGAGEYVAQSGSGAALRRFDPGGDEVPGSPGAKVDVIDLAVDEARGVVWASGATLVRGDASTLTASTVATFDSGIGGVSLDVVPSDGSVWVAERRLSGTGGAVHHYGADGAEVSGDLHPWNASPVCVRVNPRTGDVWVADSGGISRIDTTGAVHVVDSSGVPWWSIAIDVASGITWVAGADTNPTLDAYSAGGTLLSSMGGFSTSQKWVVVIR
jgi:hypothetical protein